MVCVHVIRDQKKRESGIVGVDVMEVWYFVSQIVSLYF